MAEKNLSSKKIKYGKRLRIAWLAVGIIFLLITILSMVQYISYKKGQDLAIELTMAVTSQFDNKKDNRVALINAIYKFYNPEYYYNSFVGIGNWDVLDAARDADHALAKLMTEAGCECSYGSYYLEHTGFVDFAINKSKIPYIIAAGLLVILLLLNILYMLNQKKSMTIAEDRIICRNGAKTTKEFFIRDITCVDQASFKGILIRGNNIKYKINLLENADELKAAFLNKLAEYQAQVTADKNEVNAVNQRSTVNEIKKYKELLDAGIISHEEFDAKKKQLLDL